MQTRLLPAAAPARPSPDVECLVEVDGTVEMAGPGKCQFWSHPGGSFDLTVTYDVPLFARVEIDRRGAAIGSFGEAGPKPSRKQLGTMHRNGACWENARAKICAWKN